MAMNSVETIRTILRNSRTIAVVGLSSKPFRPSFGVARYLQSVGYRIVPVNPAELCVLGEPAYATLSAIPGKVDLVNVFRRSDEVEPVVDEAIAIGAGGIWLQEGVFHETACRKALQAGLLVVANRCMLKEHVKLRAESIAHTAR